MVSGNCQLAEESVIGCAAPFEQTADAACFRRVSDESLWIGSSSVFDRELYERCDDATYGRVASAPICD